MLSACSHLELLVQLGAYCLNFSGRVTHASVKNFQLVSTTDMESVILQFGKASAPADPTILTKDLLAGRCYESSLCTR